jgi:hypothetical protein
MYIIAVRREGAGLPLWTDWGGKGGYHPLILSPASEVGFFLSRYLRWDTRICKGKGKVRFILTPVVGTSSDPSDEIHV